MPDDHTTLSVDEDYEAYLKERQALTEAQQRSDQDADKWLLTLAGGALAVSMTFVSDITPDPSYSLVLVFSWMFFGLAIGALLTAMRLSPDAFEVFRDILDEEFQTGGDDVWTRVRRRQHALPQTERIAFLNKWSLRMFLTGVTLMGLFVWINMS